MNCGNESVVIDFCELMTSLAELLPVNLTSLFSIMICLIFLNCALEIGEMWLIKKESKEIKMFFVMSYNSQAIVFGLVNMKKEEKCCMKN